MTLAYVGLGANLGEREARSGAAAALIGALRLSSIRETEPWGLTEQPRFLNAVAELDTELAPRALLERLLEVERTLGRVRDGAALGAADDRPRSAPLRLRDDRRARPDRPPPAAARSGCSCSSRSPSSRRDLVVPGRGTVSTLLAGLQSPA